ncbi:hypothetical protein BSKO_14060 [Bryopsis sp. KO-2023]|nr:hypothetical protein BSKO_14060 [Bryopsis sp. KO-2023]
MIQDSCAATKQCELAEVPDLGHVATLNSMFEGGILSKDMYEDAFKKLKESAETYCVPKRFHQCIQRELHQGVACSTDCPLTPVQVAEWRQDCKDDSNSCCQFGTSQDICESAVVAYTFCDQMPRMMNLTVAEMCATDGPDGAGLDMCKDEVDKSKKCHLCTRRLRGLKRTFEKELDVGSVCELPRQRTLSRLGVTCQHVIKELSMKDWLCTNKAAGLSKELIQATDLSKLCQSNGFCDGGDEDECKRCASFSKGAQMFNSEKIIDLSSEEDAAEYCYLSYIFDLMEQENGEKYEENTFSTHGGGDGEHDIQQAPGVEAQGIEGDQDAVHREECMNADECNADDGCYETGKCVPTSDLEKKGAASEEDYDLGLHTCDWNTERDSCNQQEGCVFSSESQEDQEDGNFCDRLETMVVTYGFDFARNGTQAAFSMGLCGKLCGVGCTLCDDAINEVSKLTSQLDEKDLVGAARTARETCETMHQRESPYPKGRCISRAASMCHSANSRATCEAYSKSCTYIPRCVPIDSKPKYCKMARPSKDSKAGVRCRALETCLDLCPGAFCSDCEEASGTLISLMKESRPESTCRFSLELTVSFHLSCSVSLYGNLRCDPANNKCCDALENGKGGLYPIKEECADRPHCEFEPQNIPRCVLAKDVCTEYFQETYKETGKGVCAKGCHFVKTGDYRALPLKEEEIKDIDGDTKEMGGLEGQNEMNSKSKEAAVRYGFCIDRKGVEHCEKGSSSTGTCPKDVCIPREKTCHVRASNDFGCDGKDQCCVPSTTKKIKPSDCSSESGCTIKKRCVRTQDPCRKFQYEWECSEQRGRCTWNPSRDSVNAFSGSCVGVRNECEGLSEEYCEKRATCAVVDRCETNPCDPEDECCPLSERTCKTLDGCTISGKCHLRRDDCSFQTDKKSCAAKLDCSWDEEDERCSIATNPCDPISSEFHCNTMRDESKTLMCKWTPKCTNNCETCKSCIDEMAAHTIANKDVQDSNTIAKGAVSACERLGLARDDCRKKLYRAVIYSQNGSFGKRPMALCSELGLCDGSCAYTVGKTEMVPDFCTSTGLSEPGQAIVQQSTPAKPDSGTCFRTTDCSSPNYCSFTSPIDTCSCNKSNGRDKCISKGTCKDFCDQFTEQIAAANNRYTNCVDNSGCPEGFACDTSSAKSKCRVVSCSNAELEKTDCDGICVPGVREITSAKFSDQGNKIIAALNFPARKSRFLCSKAFNKAAVALLGEGAQCFTSERELTIRLRRGATIAPSDSITLEESQKVLKDTLGGSFSGTVVVTSCGTCEAPEVSVVYPSQLSAGCSGTVGAAMFDATYSKDTAGRVLQSAWSIDENACYRAASNDAFGTSSDCTALKTIVDALGDSGSLEVDGTIVDSLAAGDYKITYKGTNFLGASATQDIIFTKSATAVPVVGIVGGKNEFDFILEEGIQVAAFVDLSSVCEGYTVEYDWTSLDTPAWPALEGGYKRKNFVLRGPITTARPENDYNIRISATLKDASGVVQGTVGQDVLLHAHGSPIIPRIKGKYGDVALVDDVCLDASASIDPDDPQQLTGFSVEWKCEKHEIGGEACFTGSNQPVVEGTRLCIPPELLTVGVWYYYTAKVSKTDVGVTTATRSGTTTIAFRPKPADSPVPIGSIEMQCGARDCPRLFNPTDLVNLMVTVEKPYARNTSIAWSCDGIDDLEGIVIGGIHRQNLLIKPNMLGAGAEITCSATLTRNDIDTDSGTAVKTFTMNSPPYCGAVDGGCIIVSQTSESNAYPNAVYRVKAQEFADEGARLVYVFGEYVGSNPKQFVAHRRGLRNAFNFKGLEEGEHVLVVRAYDSFGAYTEEVASVTVDAPAADYVPDIGELQQVRIDSQKGEQAGDPEEVLAQSRKAVRLLQRAQGGNGVSENDGKEMAASFTDACIGQVSENPEEVDVDEYLIAQGILGDLCQNNFTQSADIDKMLNAAVRGLTASEYGSVEYTPDQCIGILNVVTAGIAKRNASREDSSDSAEFFDKFKTTIKKCSALACIKSTPGTDPVESGSSADGFAGIDIACQRETVDGMNGKSFKIGKTKSGDSRRRLQSFSPESAQLTLPSDFAEKCGEHCPDAQLETSVQYITDTSAHEALLGTLVIDVGITNEVIVSGILDIDFPSHLGAGELCPSETCALTVDIPVDESKWSDAAGIVTICMLIKEGVAVSGPSSGIDYVSYDPAVGLAKCVSTRYGEMFVAQYMAPPAPPQPPTPPTSPPAPIPEAPSVHMTVELAVKFSGDYEELKNDQVFLGHVRNATAVAAEVPLENVRVVKTRRGSIVVEMEIDFPPGKDDNEIEGFVDAMNSNPASMLVFDSSFEEIYGGPHPVDKEKEGGDRMGLIAGIACAVMAAIFTLIVCSFKIARWRKYTNDPARANYEPA